jgi:hypothetical protein
MAARSLADPRPVRSRGVRLLILAVAIIAVAAAPAGNRLGTRNFPF